MNKQQQSARDAAIQRAYNHIVYEKTGMFKSLAAGELGLALSELYDAAKGESVTVKAEPRECLWVENSDGQWETGCKNMFEFLEDGPEENKTRFCCYCGGRLVAVRHEDYIEPQQPDPAESTDADKGVCECGHDRNQHRVSLTGYRPCSICWNDLEDGIEKDVCSDFKPAQQPEPSEFRYPDRRCTPPASEQSEVCGNCDKLAQTQAALKRLYHAEIKRRSVNDPLGMNAAMEEAGKWF